jgi:hypothetical protein
VSAKGSAFIGWLEAFGTLAAAAPAIVVAADYLSVADAQRALFPEADRYVEVALSLTPAQHAQVAALAGTQPPHRSLRAFQARKADVLLGYLFVDEVIGKEDFITYAASIDAAGRLGPLEVLSYRESHGGEIRNESWRRQFEGRAGLAQLRVPTDIKNIAGATLSCEHVTQGVRWLVALWQVALRPPSAG